MKIHEYFILID